MNTDIKTWIFLRGLTRESRHWGDFVGQFQQTLPGSRVVALDLPGNGPLNHLRSPLRVPDMVAHCRDQLASSNIKPPYHVLAMSLGAMVAVAWADAHPQEVAANVLINTSMRPFSPFYQRLRPANYGTLLQLVLSGATPEVWARTVLRLTRSGRALSCASRATAQSTKFCRAGWRCTWRARSHAPTRCDNWSLRPAFARRRLNPLPLPWCWPVSRIIWFP